MDTNWNTKAYRIRHILLILTDIIVIQIASFLAIYVRYDFRFSKIESYYLDEILRITPLHTLFVLAVFALAKLYSSVWRYASVDELFNIVVASMVVLVCDIISFQLLSVNLPRSFIPMFALFLMLGVFACRFSYRLMRLMKEKITPDKGTNVMLVGAGAAGLIIAKEIKGSSYLDYNLQCIIDDNPNKLGKYVQGIKIVGGTNTIEENAVK